MQAKNVDGTWIPVQPIKDSIVVNTGELLEYWTGGYYPATVSITNNNGSYISVFICDYNTYLETSRCGSKRRG